MRPSLRFILLSLAAAAFPRTAAADDAAPAKAEVLALSAHRTANDLRHRWDAMRAKNPAVASCLEGKFLQALSVARRIDEHRLALHDEPDAKERARRLAAIDRLAERRAELWEEATSCDPSLAVSATNATVIRVVASANIAPVDVEVPDFTSGLSPTVWSAFLRLRW